MGGIAAACVPSFQQQPVFAECAPAEPVGEPLSEQAGAQAEPLVSVEPAITLQEKVDTMSRVYELDGTPSLPWPFERDAPRQPAGASSRTPLIASDPVHMAARDALTEARQALREGDGESAQLAFERFTSLHGERLGAEIRSATRQADAGRASQRRLTAAELLLDAAQFAIPFAGTAGVTLKVFKLLHRVAAAGTLLPASGGALLAGTGMGTALGAIQHTGREITEAVYGRGADAWRFGRAVAKDTLDSAQSALALLPTTVALAGTQNLMLHATPLGHLARRVIQSTGLHTGLGVGVSAGAYFVNLGARQTVHASGLFGDQPAPAFSWLGLGSQSLGGATATVLGRQMALKQFAPAEKFDLIAPRDAAMLKLDGAMAAAQAALAGIAGAPVFGSLRDVMRSVLSIWVVRQGTTSAQTDAGLQKGAALAAWASGGGAAIDKAGLQHRLRAASALFALHQQLEKVKHLPTPRDPIAAVKVEGAAARAMGRALNAILAMRTEDFNGPVAHARRVFQKYMMYGHLGNELRAEGTVQPSVAGASNRVVAGLADAATDPRSSVSRLGADVVDHTKTIAGSTARAVAASKRRALDQQEFDRVVVHAGANDMKALGRAPAELAGLKTALLHDAVTGKPIAANGQAAWKHAVASQPQLASQPRAAGELLHTLPSFDDVHDMVLRAGGDAAMAREVYAGALGHGLAPDSLLALQRAGLRVDFRASARAGSLSAGDANALTRLRDETLAYLSAGSQQQAADLTPLRTAVNALPEHISLQYVHTEANRMSPSGLLLQFAQGTYGRPTNMQQYIAFNARNRMQHHHEFGVAIGRENEFRAASEKSARRLGLVFDAQLNGYRELRSEDGKAYTDFARRLEANDALKQKYLADSGLASTVRPSNLIDWFRALPAEPKLADLMLR